MNGRSTKIKENLGKVAACGCILLLASCDRTEPPVQSQGTNVVATVAGEAIHRERVLQSLERRYPNPDHPLSLEEKQAALEIIINNEALFAQAKASGFITNAELQERIKALVISAYGERHGQDQGVAITEEEIRSHYEARGKDYMDPAGVRGSVLLVAVPQTANEESRARARERATQLLEEVRGLSDERRYAELVAARSDDQPTRYRSGDIGWLREGGKWSEPAVAEALLGLSKAGQVAPLVETSRGFWIVKAQEVRPAARKPLREVRELIRYRLEQEKLEAARRSFFAKAREGLKVVIYTNALEQINVPLRKAGPPQLQTGMKGSS